ncbi:MAG: hypothetical protein DRQ10_05600 [Candidatus Hydrothermota bacterium]|nr:MAG: hypothetical protein DRQ10_05600 [Candidatus Hydrothermae bacterium]
MKGSIFVKIFTSFLFVILLISTSIASFAVKRIKSHYIDTLSSDLKKISYPLSLSIKPLIEQRRFSELDSLVKSIGRETNIRITVIATDGTVLADSKKDPSLMENHGTRPEVIQALSKGYGETIRYSTTMQKKMLYVAIPLKTNGKIIGILRLSLFLSDIEHLLSNLSRDMICMILIITALSLLGAYFLAKGFSDPIRELVSVSNRLALGDFSAKASIQRKDELGKLASSFNEMGERIKKLFERVRLKQEELIAILSSLSEGLIVIDGNGRIELSNRSFDKIVGDSSQGRFYREVLRDSGLIKCVEKAVNEKRTVTKEVELNDKLFLISITPMVSENKFIVVLHDITEFKAIEKIKKDFVINASHELRTPLTAIKGYVETLEDEVQGEAKTYLKIIRKHTERIINIVKDLLTLAEIEEKGLDTSLKDIYLKGFLENVVKIFRPRAEEKGLELKFTAQCNPVIKGDPFKLEQVFVNLIDNAIKYTEKGEVSILLREENGYAVVEVIDTGIGIPKEYIPRIFERFYVVDKSRSRKLGGTGLGLSIVKHVVLLHGGKIEVESEPGKGSKFIVRLPVNS